jgi:hypothetical protein
MTSLLAVAFCTSLYHGTHCLSNIYTTEQSTVSRSLCAGVDYIVGGLQSATQFWSTSHAHGVHPVTSLLSRSLEEIRNVVDGGTSFSLSDLVGFAYQISCEFVLYNTYIFSLMSLRISTQLLILAVLSVSLNEIYMNRSAL